MTCCYPTAFLAKKKKSYQQIQPQFGLHAKYNLGQLNPLSGYSLCPIYGFLQWLKKLSQCLAILKRLTCHKSNKID